MTTLSVPLNIFFFHQFQTTHTSSFLHHSQTVTFSPRKTVVKTACSSSQQNPQQRQKHHKKKQFNDNIDDIDSDEEKGLDPIGFLSKRGISNKAFAQFLRERQVNRIQVGWCLVEFAV